LPSQRNESLDLLYLDSVHSYGQTHSEMIRVDRVISKRGYICGHDFGHPQGGAFGSMEYGVIEVRGVVAPLPLGPDHEPLAGRRRIDRFGVNCRANPDAFCALSLIANCRRSWTLRWRTIGSSLRFRSTTRRIDRSAWNGYPPGNPARRWPKLLFLRPALRIEHHPRWRGLRCERTCMSMWPWYVWPHVAWPQLGPDHSVWRSDASVV